MSYLEVWVFAGNGEQRPEHRDDSTTVAWMNGAKQAQEMLLTAPRSRNAPQPQR